MRDMKKMMMKPPSRPPWLACLYLNICIAQEVKVRTKEHLVFYITMGDSTKLKYQYMCPDVELSIQGTICSIDLYIFAIGRIDVVLGVTRLRTLRRIE